MIATIGCDQLVVALVRGGQLKRSTKTNYNTCLSTFVPYKWIYYLFNALFDLSDYWLLFYFDHYLNVKALENAFIMENRETWQRFVGSPV